MPSEVGICNLALIQVGELSIRSLEESTDRAGLCKTLYPIVRDMVLSSYNWSFARKTELLQRLDVDSVEGPTYQIPSDCLTPICLWPRGQLPAQYKVMGDKIIIPTYRITGAETFLATDRYLQYVRRETNTALFSSSFVDLLSLSLAARLAVPLANDIKWAATIQNELRIARQEAEAEDANRDDEYRNANEDPENDTFVNPPGGGRAMTYVGGVGWVYTS